MRKIKDSRRRKGGGKGILSLALYSRHGVQMIYNYHLYQMIYSIETRKFKTRAHKKGNKL